jgi:DNA-binding NarL/FixJ family response regulator
MMVVPPETRALRVLLVDDAETLRHVLALCLGDEEGFEVVAEAGDGRNAVELARRTQPDVVLLDLAMPVMDGFEALPLIRQAAPDARVIVHSSCDEVGTAERLLAAGAYAFVEKGLDPDLLVARLRELTAA